MYTLIEVSMNKYIISRVKEEAEYILRTQETIREISKVFKVSKSTVHKDLHERLLEVNYDLFEEVNKVLQFHTYIRHIRGGESTKKKYLKMNEK